MNKHIFPFSKYSLLALPLLLMGCDGSVIVAFNGIDDDIIFDDCSELPTRYSYIRTQNNATTDEFSIVKQWSRSARELTVTTTDSEGEESVVEFHYASVESLKDEIDTFGLLQFETAIERLDGADNSGTIDNSYNSEGFLIRERIERTGKLDNSSVTTELTAEFLWQSHFTSGRPADGFYEFTRKEGGVIVDECEEIEIENRYNNSQRTLIVTRSRTNDTRCEDEEGDYDYRESIERFTFNGFGHVVKQELWLESQQGSAPDMDNTPNTLVNVSYDYDRSIDICI